MVAPVMVKTRFFDIGRTKSVFKQQNETGVTATPLKEWGVALQKVTEGDASGPLRAGGTRLRPKFSAGGSVHTVCLPTDY